jgi:predicted RNase H-like HicB family nuclease
MDRRYTILATWDAEAGVWVATSEEVLGLATEADTIPALVEKLERILPELLVENGQIQASDGPPEVPFCIMHEHVARSTAH